MPSWRHVTSLAMAWIMMMMLAFVVLYNMIDPPALGSNLAKQTSIMYYADGKAEMTRIGPTNREIVPLANIPPNLQNAVIAAENRSFRTDKGISPRGIARAFFNNLTGGATQGGSTITQQYAKQAFTNEERTLSRKLKEFFYAIKIDQVYTKDQILEVYLNQTYFGRGAYGVETAAKAYFGKSSIGDISLEQSAVLAALIRSPENLYNPDKHLDGLKQRWGYVLDSMVDMGKVSPERRAKAKFPKIREWSPTDRYAGSKGYIISAVEQELLDANVGITKEDIQTGGLRIVTTIDKNMQRAAFEAIRDNWPRKYAKDTNIGLVSVWAPTGEIKAMYGGKDYLKNAFNNATQARVRPGSTFKTFGLAAALTAGWSMEDNYFEGNSPLKISGTPLVRNQGDRDWGEKVSLLKGMENSINTVLVQMASKLGPPAVKKAAIAAGIPEEAFGTVGADAGIVIGTSSPHVVDMAGAYATFANGGTQIKPHLVKEVRRADGSLIDLKRDEPVRGVFSPEVVNNVNYALSQVVEVGTGQRAKALNRPVAGKTGNHQGLTLWFAGYTPNQLSTAVGIWRGPSTDELVNKDDDDSPQKWALDGYSYDGKSVPGFGEQSLRAGGGYPALIWTDFMQAALEGKDVIPFEPYIPHGEGRPQFAPPAPPPAPTPTQPPTVPPTEPPEPTLPPPSTPTPTPTTSGPPGHETTPPQNADDW